MKPKVILDPHVRAIRNIFSPKDFERLSSLVEIVWGKDEQMPAAEVERVQREVLAIVCGRWHFGDVRKFEKLSAILEVSGGHPSSQDLDYSACFSRGIRVLSCAPAFGPVVAEMALGLALSAARGIATTDAAFRASDSEPNWSHTELGGAFTLFDKPAGFIGFGSLARHLKPLLAPFRAPIQVYDPWLTDTYLRTQGVTPVDLDTLLRTSRFIYVLAVPSAGNEALLSREKLELIRPNAVLLLMSRSHVVDFEALTELLSQGRFRAGIDVFPSEPLDRNHPIRKVPNTVLSSHRAGAVREGIESIGHLVVNDLEAIVSGKVPQQLQHAEPEFIRRRDQA